MEGAHARGLELDSVTIEQDYRPDFMLTTTPVLCSLTWDPKTHEVKGGAFFSKHDISQSANVISLAIQTHMTINWVNAVAMAAVAKAKKKTTTPVA